MAMREPASTKKSGEDEAKRDTLKLNKETLKDLATDAQIKGGVRKTRDPDEGGE